MPSTLLGTRERENQLSNIENHTLMQNIEFIDPLLVLEPVKNES